MAAALHDRGDARRSQGAILLKALVNPTHDGIDRLAREQRLASASTLLVDVARGIEPPLPGVDEGGEAPVQFCDQMLVHGCPQPFGARISEICLIESADVLDSGDRIVLVLGVHKYAEKTGRREVPITLPEAISALREAISQMARDGRPDGRIWLRRNGRLVDHHEKTYTGKRLAALPWGEMRQPRFTSHGLRRLAVKMLRQAGVPLEVAAHLLGHSIMTMLKTYREIDADERMDAMQRARLGAGAGNVRSIR